MEDGVDSWYARDGRKNDLAWRYVERRKVK